MKHTLVRQDLLKFEQRLCESLGRIFSFEAHVVYFPQKIQPEKPQWLPEEGKLLLPLILRGNLLGVFMARISDGERIAALLPFLPDIAALCLENLELYKNGCLDDLTGLATRQVLLERLVQETDHIRTSFFYGPDDAAEQPGFSSLGVIVIKFNGLRDVAKNAGYGFADRLTAAMALAFTAAISAGQALGARIEECSFAALLPGATFQTCARLAMDVVNRLDQVRLPDPLTGRKLGAVTSAGYALFPQDMDGIRHFRLTEQPRVLLHRAEIAADTAARWPKGLKPVRVMGYGQLLSEGGYVKQVFPLSRVLTSLGYVAGAREGQHFSVWSGQSSMPGKNAGEKLQPVYKGELVLREVHEYASMAEILQLGDPSRQIGEGDALVILPAERALHLQQSTDGSGDIRADPVTGFWLYEEFLARLVRGYAGLKQFCIVLLHMDMSRTGDDGTVIYPDVTLEQNISQLAGICRKHFLQSGYEDVLGGRFGLNSLIFFHPDEDVKNIQSIYEALCTEAASCLGVRTAAGIASWPFLRFSPEDMINCSRKALDYALLLPAPHVGLFDSLAINISADKHHLSGDVFEAIEEYKLALLADADNVLAWNSLGVCLATLGNYAEAKKNFEEALKRTPKDSMLEYNLGTVCLSLHDTAAAADRFRNCLALTPNHMYARVRLGQLAEAAGNIDEARLHYQDAVDLDAESSLPLQRLAVLARQEGSLEQAREYLHQALLRNPTDAVALSLMAELYLDGGEDPELAETLARQSVARRPDLRKGWIVLARALEALGRRGEAHDALVKAGDASFTLQSQDAGGIAAI